MALLLSLRDDLLAGHTALRATAQVREYVYAVGKIFGYVLYTLGEADDTHEYYKSLPLLLSAIGDVDLHSLEPEAGEQWGLLARGDHGGLLTHS